MEKNRKSPGKAGLMLSQLVLLSVLFSCSKNDLDYKRGSKEPISTTESSSETTSTSSEIGSVSALSANILYYENADGSGPFTTYVSKHTSTSYGITASTSQFFNGSKSARFELRDSDPLSHNGTRAELSFPDATNLNRWYSYAIFFPSAQWKYDSQDEVISQWHQGGGKTPALALRTRRDHIYVRTVENTWHDLGLIDKDKWHTYVMHVKHSSGSDGLIEIWRDGQKIFNRTGSNMYSLSSGDFHNPKLKMGIYKSDWNGSETTDVSQRVLYFDDIKLGNENATYNEMVPTGTGTTTSTVPTTPTSPSTSGQSVVSFNLVNSSTEKDVLTITDGKTISLSALGLTKINIRAVTSSSDVGSVKLQLSGLQSKTFTDNAAPFALHGDDGNGNFYYGNWNPPALGTYTLKATPYSADNAAGTVGTAKTITFTIAK